jgi:diguanylate cyclase (GGDEF)-like protein
LLPNTSVEEARKVAEKLRTMIERTEFSIDGESIRVKASFGIASIRCEENSLDRAYERVDRALYTAKQSGRNIVVSET